MDIALIDDHQLLTDSLKAVLSASGHSRNIRTFINADAFLLSAWHPHIIITDILMPGTNGIELIEKLRMHSYTNTKVIVLSGVTDVQTIRQAIRSGAAGYISKNTGVEELGECITAVSNGEQYISARLRNSLLTTLFTEEQVVFHLSHREKEVLHLICSGHTVKEAAYKMQLSVHTVHSYQKTIMKKLKVNRTADLIVFAMQKGLYNPMHPGSH
ncbi:DNA-binding NarL/FixJ family response regulator [Filimonas zeae]|uniref:DNA-binding response regulator n=1 Tax=Filimonas zeae TaxID=1737353 RepID=A0A917IWA8_9BACT|nr:response regulator transcription factor [Filimonas zeae]MDR6338804.1 DNA-binding NarL/FixJ family response regulator [Filimonas zeae]GGH66522.1 DNA-binding response regulator [Filimonas zeae]